MVSRNSGLQLSAQCRQQPLSTLLTLNFILLASSSWLAHASTVTWCAVKPSVCTIDNTNMTANDFNFTHSTTHCNGGVWCANNGHNGAEVSLDPHVQPYTVFALPPTPSHTYHNAEDSQLRIRVSTNVTSVPLELVLLSHPEGRSQPIYPCGDPSVEPNTQCNVTNGFEFVFPMYKWPYAHSNFDITRLTALIIQFQDLVPEGTAALFLHELTFESLPGPNRCATDADCQAFGDHMATCNSGTCTCPGQGYSGPNCQPTDDVCSGKRIVFDGSTRAQEGLVVSDDTLASGGLGAIRSITTNCPAGMTPPCSYAKNSFSTLSRVDFRIALNPSGSSGGEVDLSQLFLTIKMAEAYSSPRSWKYALIDSNGFTSGPIGVVAAMQSTQTVDSTPSDFHMGPNDWTISDSNFNLRKVVKIMFSNTNALTLTNDEVWLDDIVLTCPTMNACNYDSMCTAGGDMGAKCTGFQGSKNCMCSGAPYNASRMCGSTLCTMGSQCRDVDSSATCRGKQCLCSDSYRFWGPRCENNYNVTTEPWVAVSEDKIVQGGEVLSVRLSGNTWQSALPTSTAMKTAFINALNSTAVSPSGLSELIPCMLASPQFALSADNTLLHITLPPCPYFALGTNMPM